MESYELKDLPEDTRLKQVNGVWIKASEYVDPLIELKERVLILENKIEVKK